MSTIFEDVAEQAGIILNTEEGCFGVNWLDFNNDGLPDLFTTPHAVRPKLNNYQKLYINKGDGTFIDKRYQYFPDFTGDTHAASWADFDNDGDPDLFLTTGAVEGTGAVPKFVFVNQGGNLVNQAKSLGLDFQYGRGRIGLWFDWNNDGLLDLVQVNDIRKEGLGATTLFEQKADSTFVNANENAGFDAPESSLFGQVADLFGDGTQDVILFSDVHKGNGIVKLYQKPSPDDQSTMLKDITNKLPTIVDIGDAAIADFNGDLINDIFLARSKRPISRSNIIITDPSSAFVRLWLVGNQKEIGVSFKTTDSSVNFDFWQGGILPSQIMPTSNIFIGNTIPNYHPSSTKFSLSVDDPNVRGIIPKANRTKDGLYIGYNEATKTWKEILFVRNRSHPTTPQKADLIIDTSTSVSDLTSINFTIANAEQLESTEPILLTFDPQTGQYVNNTQAAGFNKPISSQCVVAGDFDNDMDVDLYLTSTSLWVVRQSKYYENQGNGTFVEDPNAGGALIKIAGPTIEDIFPTLEVSTGDYNRDGFLDLFVGSSTAIGSTRTIYQGTPYHLFKNKGNNNHWLEIDLEGTQSNRDAIGSKVYVTAGGVTQMREQTGGMHRMSQNEQILHFGLGSNTNVDNIIIKWDSGLEQQFNNIAADQLIHYVESSIGGDNNNHLFNGTSNDDTILGMGGNDTLNGLGGNDSLDGGTGNDVLNGGIGNDVYVVDSTEDVIEDTSSIINEIDRVISSISYTLGNNLENLTFTEDENLQANGNSLNNEITGNNGNNNLNGSQGYDTLSGGAGNDSFEFSSGSAFNSNVGVDRIVDFTNNSDKIVLSKTTFTAITSNIGTGFSKGSEFATVTTFVQAQNITAAIVYNTTNDRLYYNQNGTTAGFGTGGALAELLGNPNLVASDFLVLLLN